MGPRQVFTHLLDTLKYLLLHLFIEVPNRPLQQRCVREHIVGGACLYPADGENEILEGVDGPALNGMKIS